MPRVTCMKRRAWHMATATATAFFMLYAPLCALACLTSADSVDSVNVSSATQSNPPCHAPAPSSSPAEPAGTPETCDCEEPGGAALLSNTQNTFSNAASVAVVGPHAPPSILAPPSARVSRGHPEATDLPPPDILLLKSTLLI